MHLWSLRQQENKNYNESVSDLSLEVINTTNKELNSLEANIKTNATQSEIIANFASPEKIALDWWFTLQEWYIIEDNWSKQTPTNTLSQWEIQKMMTTMSNYEIWLAA